MDRQDAHDDARDTFRAVLRPLGIAVVAVSALLLALAPVSAADSDSIEELERRIAELERRIETLRSPGAGSDDAAIAELERSIEVLAEEIEDLRIGKAAVSAPERGRYGLAPAASKVYEVDQGVSIGGYGEMLYESFASEREDGSAADETDELDFLRAIVYFGYKFNDRIVFNSEIEIEHASTGRDGEVSVEFAFLDFLIHDAFNVRAGMVLPPMGFVNELHEPPIFLGAKRPQVEQRIIPSTWRENGVGAFGEIGPVSYRAYLTTALIGVSGTASDAGGFSDSGVRDGRTKGSKSPFESPAFTGRIDVEPLDGLLFGGSWYIGDSGQSQLIDPNDPASGEVDASLTMFDVHVDYRYRGFQARGLWVQSTLDDADDLTLAQYNRGAFGGPAGTFNGRSIAEKQTGWYGEVGYDVLAELSDSSHELIPYVRYERYDTQDEIENGSIGGVAFTRNPARDVTISTIGVAWKPIREVIVKADWNIVENEAETGVDQFNVALGYLF